LVEHDRQRWAAAWRRDRLRARGRPDTTLADLLVERGWVLPADRGPLDYLVERKLQKHGGDARASLAAAGQEAALSVDALRRSRVVGWPGKKRRRGEGFGPRFLSAS
jgi:hypothetical protein